jgi:hypothetical protein
MPSSLRKALHELPTTLDDTYERVLQGIPKEQWQQAHRLFQCLVAGIRPLHFEELAEMFARELDSNAVPNLVEGWRPEKSQSYSAFCMLLVNRGHRGRWLKIFSRFSFFGERILDL